MKKEVKTYQELVGQRFGSLVVEKVFPRKKDATGRKYLDAEAVCQCDCGNQKIIKCLLLIGGYVGSCGCMQGNRSGKGNPRVGKRKKHYYCVNPEPNCSYSTILHICCHECPKQCARKCENLPAKCGAHYVYASLEVRDFLERKGETADDEHIFR